MPASPTVTENPRERLAHQKARLRGVREQARERYAGGSPALEVASFLSATIDQFFVEMFLGKLGPFGLNPADIQQQLAIVAIGGSGRGELAPYSDADILFLLRRGASQRMQACLGEAVRDCWDSGMKLGHSVRTLRETLSAALKDPQLATSLVESRPLWGDARLVDSLRFRFRRQVSRTYAAFIRNCLQGRAEEQGQFGMSDRQLEPNVKCSAGGLRDIHLVRWVGFAAYGTSEPDHLRLEGALTLQDAMSLTAGHEFLTRIRCDLHFHAGKPQEVLSREEQLRLADEHGYTPTPAQRPVERFMQDYFRHSTAIADVASRFVARHRPRSLLSRIGKFFLSHHSNQLFIVAQNEIDVVARRRDEVCQSLELMLNLHELAGLYGVDIAPELVEAIRQAAPKLPKTVSHRAARIFASMLGQTGQVGRMLRSLYRTGLLEIVLPEIAHARCLLQFNQYHAFTVDEHSLRAVEAAESFATDTGPLGAAYRGLRTRQVLHLALLLHDLGKGHEEDHSEVGLQLSRDVAVRLDLPAPASETLGFLVHKHLIMSHVAFRRDLTDPMVVSKFAREVGSPERLTLLYLLTAADMTAVGPGAWTKWKADLVTDLYDRTLLLLSGRPAEFGEADRLRRIVAAVDECLRAARVCGIYSARRLQAFPEHYLSATSPEQIAVDLQDVARLDSEPVIVRSRYAPDTHTVEYRVITRDSIGSGLFSKLTGALTAKRLEILSANICTTSDGVVVDSFHVQDGDHSGEVPEFRLREIETAIRDVLLGAITVETLFERHKRFSAGLPALPAAEPNRVVIDNDSSSRCTVVDVFATDRPGLLYTIAAALLELGLSVELAKIGTHVDQVNDVFYVTDRAGGKVIDESRLLKIQQTLIQRLCDFERHGLVTARAG